MATNKTHKNASKGTVAQPVQEEAIDKKEAFFAKYKKVILAAVIVIVVIIAGVILYNTYVVGPREEKASTAIAKAQELFGDERYEEALNGDGLNYDGFIVVASDYSGTKAGNLANLYAGLCYAKMDKWQEATDYLKKYKAGDDIMISPAATAALGNAYAHIGDLDKAVDCLKKAAAKADNNSLSPTFLIQAGEILESQGKAAEALVLYKEIKEKYFNSMQYQTIDKYIERASVNN